MSLAEEIINAGQKSRQLAMAEPMQQLQQVGALQGILAKAQAAQQDQQLRGILAQSGGDVEKAMGALLQSGNVAAAHQLAPILKQQREQKVLEGLDMSNPESIRRASLLTGHSLLAPAADRLEARQANAAQVPAMLGQPAGIPAGTVIGNQRETLNVSPEDAAAVAQIRQGQGINTGQGMRATDNPPALSAGGGLFAPLLDSQNPAIAARAKQLQAMITPGMNPAAVPFLQKQAAELTAQDARFRQAKEMQTSGAQIRSDAQRAAAETKGTPGYATQGSLDPVADKDTIRNLATESLYDNNALSGFRRDTKAMGNIMRTRTELMKEAGITPEDVVSGRAGFKADTTSLNKITPQYDAIVAFEKTAIRNGEILKTLADKVDTTGVPALERWIRAGRKTVAGDTDVAKLDAQMQIYRTEAARILTNPNLTGQLTDSARHEVEGFLSGGSSAGQIREVVDLLKRDFDNRKQTLEEQIGSIRGRMRARVGPGGGAGMSEKPAAALGAIPEFASEDAALAAGVKGKVKINGRNATID